MAEVSSRDAVAQLDACEPRAVDFPVHRNLNPSSRKADYYAQKSQSLLAEVSVDLHTSVDCMSMRSRRLRSKRHGLAR